MNMLKFFLPKKKVKISLYSVTICFNFSPLFLKMYALYKLTKIFVKMISRKIFNSPIFVCLFVLMRKNMSDSNSACESE